MLRRSLVISWGQVENIYGPTSCILLEHKVENFNIVLIER